MSAMYSSGTTTFTDMTGSSTTGLAFFAASWNAIAGGLERRSRRINLVERAVVQLHPDIVDWISAEDASGECLLDPAIDRFNKLPRQDVVAELAFENTAAPGLGRQQPNLRMRVVTVTFDLPYVAAFAFRLSRECFPVCNLRPGERRLDVELAPQPVDDEL